MAIHGFHGLRRTLQEETIQQLEQDQAILHLTLGI